MKMNRLDSQGVEDKLSELYSLSSDEVEHQAKAIEKDFRGWVAKNFILTDHQRLYITGMSDYAVKYFGHQCAVCFIHQLYIALVYPSQPNRIYTKWVELITHLNVRTDANDKVVVSGTIAFVISYKEPN